MTLFFKLIVIIVNLLQFSFQESDEVNNHRLLSGGAWDLVGNSIVGVSTDDEAGTSVSLSSDGNTVAIGSIGNDGSGNNAGHVRVYELNGINWVKKGLDIEGEFAGDNSGQSISMSNDGNTIAIGAIYSGDGGINSGHVRVYEWISNAWTQVGNDIVGTSPGDNFGMSVSMNDDGSIVVVGATNNNGNTGHVRVFERNGTQWDQKGQDIVGQSTGDEFGISVAVSSDGNILAIGAHLNDGNGGNSGHVRVYEWSLNLWLQRGIDIEGEFGGDQFGISVSLSSNGNTIAVGANAHNSGAGHVRVYDWTGEEEVAEGETTWAQKGVDIEGDFDSDESGVSISLSSDGNTLAIGARYDDATYYNSGQVRVFNWIGTAWVQKGGDIDGNGFAEASGSSVALSSDGSIVAVGGPGHNYYTGSVNVYKFTEDTTNPTAAPTTAATTAATTIVPTMAPTYAPPIIIESPHPYYNNMNEKWNVNIPGATCYTVAMDPQSWTPSRKDFVRIYGVSNEQRQQYPQRFEKRLYKTRLLEFEAFDISADSLMIEFRSDADRTSWGFRASIRVCGTTSHF